MGAGGTLDQVAVAGGTGLVGRHLAAFLAAGGTRVTLLSRAERVAGLPEGVVPRHWRDLPGALEGAGAVVNLCGEGIAGRRWSASRGKPWWRAGWARRSAWWTPWGRSRPGRESW